MNRLSKQHGKGFTTSEHLCSHGSLGIYGSGLGKNRIVVG